MSVLEADVVINIHRPAMSGGRQSQSSAIDAMRTKVYDGMQAAYDRTQATYRLHTTVKCTLLHASLVGPLLKMLQNDWTDRLCTMHTT